MVNLHLVNGSKNNREIFPLLKKNQMKKLEMTESEFSELSDSYAGICLACGEIQYDGVEPDAEEYECESCAENQVMGLEQALICGHLELTEDELVGLA